MATPEEIQRVREHECSMQGHEWEVIVAMSGLPDGAVCGRCGKTWSGNVKLKVIVSELVPEDQILVANPAAGQRLMNEIGWTPPERVLDVIEEILSPERVAFCRTEKQAQEIREAARQVGSIQLVD